MPHDTIVVPSASGLLLTGRGAVLSIMVGETTGTTAAYAKLYDGEGTTGLLVAQMSLPAGTSYSGAGGGPIAIFRHGLYYSLTSGTIAGSVTVRWCESDAEWNALMGVLETAS